MMNRGRGRIAMRGGVGSSSSRIQQSTSQQQFEIPDSSSAEFSAETLTGKSFNQLTTQERSDYIKTRKSLQEKKRNEGTLTLMK